jgi:hypothetical protein
MAPQTEIDSLLVAWRALDGTGTITGWRTINIMMHGNCRILAGRHFPGNEEALLVGFSTANVPHDKHLPQGQGFHTNRLERNLMGDGNVWVSLARLQAGSLEMFTMMADDIVCFLKVRSEESEDEVFRAFLGRIHAWQHFMDRGSLGILSPEAEIGLFGELIVLKSLLTFGVDAIDVLNSWVGPVGGIQDFLIGCGAIEVKTTISHNTFPAIISSLEQLDPSLIQPLFIAGVRLELRESGMILPEFSKILEKLLTGNRIAASMYENKILQAGLFNSHIGSYTRKFSHKSTDAYSVRDGFPRLTHESVSIEIKRVNYELDLSLTVGYRLELFDAVNILKGL